MDEKLLIGLLTAFGTLIGLIVWIVKHQFKESAKRQDKLESLTERSIRGSQEVTNVIKVNTDIVKENTNIVKEIKTMLENRE